MKYFVQNKENPIRRYQFEPVDVVKSRRTVWYCCKPPKVTDEMLAWCRETFGKEGFSFLTFDTRWTIDIQETYMFAFEEDASLFVLKWS